MLRGSKLRRWSRLPGLPFRQSWRHLDRVLNHAPMVVFFLALPVLSTQLPHTLTCASCHKEQAKTEPFTSMGQALRFAAADPLFKRHPKMTVRKGQFSYSIDTHDDKTIYTVSDGKETISAPIKWAFGDQSQTYVLERDGQFFESLVSYFQPIDGLDTTVGDQAIHPASVQEAFGRPLARSEITKCFDCHATNAVTNHQSHLASAHPGIRCERCHVGAEQHLQGFLDGKLAATPPKLETLSPEQISTFCGQCHRTWQTVVRNKWMGQMNVRFDPYRLALSKCYDGSDRRLSCLSCHDPHQEVIHNDKAYDSKCLACHSPGAKLSTGMLAAHPQATAMPVCPVAKSNCVSCHMPKYDMVGGHGKFTDHYIRIVQKGEQYPD